MGCPICGDVFFCEHEQQQAKIGLIIKEWLEEEKPHEYIIPDDKDITGSDR